MTQATDYDRSINFHLNATCHSDNVILDAAGEISFDAFRWAWTVQYAIWTLAVVGILITRGKARRLLRADAERMLLEGLDAQPAGR